jgi:hypothetical protein
MGLDQISEQRRRSSVAKLCSSSSCRRQVTNLPPGHPATSSFCALHHEQRLNLLSAPGTATIAQYLEGNFSLHFILSYT